MGVLPAGWHWSHRPTTAKGNKYIMTLSSRLDSAVFCIGLLHFYIMFWVIPTYDTVSQHNCADDVAVFKFNFNTAIFCRHRRGRLHQWGQTYIRLFLNIFVNLFIAVLVHPHQHRNLAASDCPWSSPKSRFCSVPNKKPDHFAGEMSQWAGFRNTS